jgi:tetratricopeptide (TPR) repeat protein
VAGGKGKGRGNEQNYSPLIYDYLKKYQEDPTSRVFAPLTEAYRKAGLIDEAIEIAREGLRVHPGFVGGRVALARCLFDKAMYSEVIAELTPVVRDVPDNLVAQRLLAESCLMLGQVAEALGCYKMLLYFSPEDVETAQIVHELEAQAYEKGSLVLRTDPKRPALVPPVSDSGPLSASEYKEAQAKGAIDQDPELKRKRWVKRIELLQGMLQRVERYRTAQVNR